MRFDLVDLQLFIAVADQRSITRGAERSHLALASAVWMLDPKRRSATRVAGRVAGEWARLRLTNRPAPGLRSSAEPLLPAALGATERSLDKLRLRLQKPR